MTIKLTDSKEEQARLELILNNLPRLYSLIERESVQLKLYRKGKDDFTTSVDLAVQNFLVRLCYADSIISEEAFYRKTSSRFTWVIDPIDGTVNGLIRQKAPFFVLINLVTRDDFCFALRVEPAKKFALLTTKKGVFQISSDGNTTHLNTKFNKNREILVFKDHVAKLKNKQIKGYQFLELLLKGQAYQAVWLVKLKEFLCWDFFNLIFTLEQLGFFVSDRYGKRLLKYAPTGIILDSKGNPLKEFFVCFRKVDLNNLIKIVNTSKA